LPKKKKKPAEAERKLEEELEFVAAGRAMRCEDALKQKVEDELRRGLFKLFD